MRGSGAKGIPRTPKGLRRYEVKEDTTTPLATNGWFRFWYEGTYNSYAGSVTFVDHEPLLGDTTYVFDLGRPYMVGGIGCGAYSQFFGTQNPLTYFAIYWSHDGVRWYSHYSPTLVERWSDEDFDTQGDTPGIALLWLKPVPRARYWKLVFPDPQGNVARPFSFFLYEERNPCVLHDHNEGNFLQLSTSNEGAHTPRTINRSRTFDFGVAPDVVWLSSKVFDGRNYGIYVTRAETVRKVDLKATTRDSKQQIVQATKRGYTVGRGLWDVNFLGFVPFWHLNHIKYTGATVLYPALALKTNKEAGVVVAIGRPDSMKFRHGLGQVPDVVLYSTISQFWSHVQTSVNFLSKDFPTLDFTPSVGNPDSVSRVTASARDGWDVDDEYFYIKEYSSSTTEVVMIALNSSSTPKARRAFGKYTGNGNSSGPTVTGLGFQPDYMGICKVSTTASTGYNGVEVNADGVVFYRWLTSDSIDDVTVGYVASYLPDGFQIISSDNRVNQSGFDYFWWAEQRNEV